MTSTRRLDDEDVDVAQPQIATPEPELGFSWQLRCTLPSMTSRESSATCCTLSQSVAERLFMLDSECFAEVEV